MNVTVSRVLLACLFLSGIPVATAQDAAVAPAPGVVISTGQEGGGYWSAGERLRQVAGPDLQVQNLASSGSLKNLERLFDNGSAVNLAFAQADALQYYLDDNPDAADSLEKLQTIGEECVFIIGEAKRKIKTVADMAEAPRMQLGIKSPKSGIWVTYHYMTKLMPELQSVSLIYGDTIELMEQLLSHLTNVDRAVMVVHGTNAHSPEIDMAAADPDRFRFVAFKDDRFSAALDGAEPLYQRKKVRSGVAQDAGKVETICVRGLLVANRSKLTAEQYSAVATLVDSRWDDIHLR